MYSEKYDMLNYVHIILMYRLIYMQLVTQNKKIRDIHIVSNNIF